MMLIWNYCLWTDWQHYDNSSASKSGHSNTQVQFLKVESLCCTFSILTLIANGEKRSKE